MTGITELAQLMRTAAEKATPGQWERGDGKHGGKLLVYCDDAVGSAVCEATSGYNAITKYQRIDNLDFIALANPANVLALVEALEKAQQRIAELSEGKVGSALLERENHHVEVVGKLTEHITELESEVEKWKQEAEVWEQVAEKQLATAIELESRTVKLVDCDFGAVQHMSGGSTDYCHGFVDGTQNAIRSITAAGIKVETE